MALLPQTASTIAKDTTPSGGRSVKYRVLERCFVNGALFDPLDAEGKPNSVMGPPGLHGGPLEQIDPPPAAPKPAVVKG